MGSTHSFDVGNGDAWIIRIDEDGNILWNQTIGDPYGNSISSFLYIGNNTYVAAGATHSLGTTHQDLWVLKFYVDAEDNSTPSNGISGYDLWLYITSLMISILIIGFIKKKIFKKKLN